MKLKVNKKIQKKRLLISIEARWRVFSLHCCRHSTSSNLLLLLLTFSIHLLCYMYVHFVLNHLFCVTISTTKIIRKDLICVLLKCCLRDRLLEFTNGLHMLFTAVVVFDTQWVKNLHACFVLHVLIYFTRFHSKLHHMCILHTRKKPGPCKHVMGM